MKGVILSIFAASIFIAFIGFANASCANENQTIMKLSSSENAHGALWNQNYGIKVCFDDYFREFKGKDTHLCSSTDVLLRLFEANNSHAATKDSSAYDVKVCHNGLFNCTIHAGQSCTKAGKKAIVYLSSLSNAHISKTYVSGYYAVCCSNVSEGRVSPTITQCIEYTTQTSCNNYAYSIAQVGCPSVKTCKCEWNITGRKCIQSYTNKKGDCEYKCNLVPVGGMEECDESGMRTVTIDAQIIPISGVCTGVTDSDCEDKVIPIPCGLLVGAEPAFLWLLASCRKFGCNIFSLSSFAQKGA